MTSVKNGLNFLSKFILFCCFNILLLTHFFSFHCLYYFYSLLFFFCFLLLYAFRLLYFHDSLYDFTFRVSLNAKIKCICFLPLQCSKIIAFIITYFGVIAVL